MFVEAHALLREECIERSKHMLCFVRLSFSSLLKHGEDVNRTYQLAVPLLIVLEWRGAFRAPTAAKDAVPAFMTQRHGAQAPGYKEPRPANSHQRSCARPTRQNPHFLRHSAACQGLFSVSEAPAQALGVVFHIQGSVFQETHVKKAAGTFSRTQAPRPGPSRKRRMVRL